MFEIKRNTIGFFLDRNITDCLKFLCCILVASSHYAQYAVAQDVNAGLLLQLLSMQGGYLGVSIFFFLSGYGLMCSSISKKLDFLPFLKKRMTKVYFPAVFVSLLWVVLICFFPTLQDVPLGLKGVVDTSNLLSYLIAVFALQFCDSVLWFVKVILLLYLLLYFYLVIREHSKPLSLIFLGVGVTMMTIGVYNCIAPFASVSIFAFALGVLSVEYKSVLLRNKWYLFLAFPIIALGGYMCRENNILLHGLINYVILFLIIIFFSCFEVRCNLKCEWIADVSYDLYLSHNKVKVIMILFSPTMHLFSFLFLSVVVAALLLKVRKVLHLL